MLMSSYVLLAALCLLLIIALIISRKDILSPFAISTIMFLISTGVAVVYMSKWQFSLSYLTVFIIISALLIFGAGEIFSKKVCGCLFKKEPEIRLDRVEIPTGLTIVIILLMCVFLFYSFRTIYALSVQGGNTEGYGAMLTYARRMTLQEGYSRNRGLNHILVFSKALSYVFGWAALHNFVYRRFKKSDCLYVIPVALGFGIYAIGTVTRGFAIEWIAYYLMLYLLMCSKKNHWKNIKIWKIALVGGGALAVFLVLFIFLGMAANRFNLASIVDTIAFYTGLSIPSLDHYIANHIPVSQIVGSETLYGVYAVLNKLGMSDVSMNMALEFISFNGVEGNVFTSLRRYINDFGYVGLYIVQFYLGVFYGFFYNFVKKQSSEGPMIVYAIFAYPLVIQAIEEKFFSAYVAVGTVNLFIYMIISYVVVLKIPQLLKDYRQRKKGVEYESRKTN